MLEPIAQSRGAAMFSDERWRDISLALGLSPRESQIVRCFFNNDKESAIAEALGISVHTVHTYCRRLYRKLNTDSRLGVILCIVDQHLELISD